MNKFREYLQLQVAELNETMANLKKLYQEGYIGTDFFKLQTDIVAGQMKVLQDVTSTYERTHRIWEEA